MAVVEILLTESPIYAMSSVANTVVEIIPSPESGLEGFNRFNITFPAGTIAPNASLYIHSTVQIDSPSGPLLVGFATHNSDINHAGCGTVLQFFSTTVDHISLEVVSVHMATMV